MSDDTKKPGVMPLARKLGEKLCVATEIPKLEPVESRAQRPGRKDVWPDEELQRMGRIWRGEEE